MQGACSVVLCCAKPFTCALKESKLIMCALLALLTGDLTAANLTSTPHISVGLVILRTLHGYFYVMCTDPMGLHNTSSSQYSYLLPGMLSTVEGCVSRHLVGPSDQKVDLGAWQ